jgi:hypothetical protein
MPLAENLWAVEGTIKMPTGQLPRRMTIARLRSGELVIFSAIALSETAMHEVEALGRPAYLIVPNGFHREDAPTWKARYPWLQVVTPSGARAGVEAVVHVDSCEDVFGDETILFQTVPGTREMESALLVASEAGTTLIVNDLIGNVQNAHGTMKLVLWLMGFAGRRPQVPRAFAARVVTDKAAVARQLRSWSSISDLRRIVVSHGATIEQDSKGVLAALADRMAKAARS